MKTVLLSFFIVIFLDAKTFEQAFNIQSIKPKVQAQQISNSYYATTAYDERKIYDITVRFSGYIQNLYANELYKSVKKGDKLFDIYPKHIRTIKKEFEFYDYDEELQSIIVEQLKDEEIDEKMLNGDEVYIPFYSKFGGVIFEKSVFVGSHVKKGDSVFKIADTTTMWVIAKVYQKDMEFIKNGMKAVVNIEGLNENITAKVSKIYPKVNKEDLTFDVRMEIDNKDGKIFPDMVAKVSIAKSLKPSLTLPKDAVLKKADKFYVFKKIGASEYEPQKVDIKYQGGYYEILSGIDENSEVAKNALFLLDSDAVTNGSYMSEEW